MCAAIRLNQIKEESGAEAVATAGGTTRTDDRVVVKAAVVGLKASPCFPCGACRQVLHEFGCQSVVVEEDGHPRAYSFAQILPHGFGPADLPGQEA